jgi:hypothetical protein
VPKMRHFSFFGSTSNLLHYKEIADHLDRSFWAYSDPSKLLGTSVAFLSNPLQTISTIDTETYRASAFKKLKKLNDKIQE